jgi:hypothetical protein
MQVCGRSGFKIQQFEHLLCLCVCVCVREREREREREDILECEIGGEIENLGKNLNNGAVER